MIVAQEDRMRGEVGDRDAIDIGISRDGCEFGVVGLDAVASALLFTPANLRHQDKPKENAEE